MLPCGRFNNNLKGGELSLSQGDRTRSLVGANQSESLELPRVASFL